mgnify:CR=1 FL=1
MSTPGQIRVAPTDEERAEGLPITQLDVSGNRRVSREDVLIYLREKPGHLFKMENVTADVRALWESGFFDDIKGIVRACPKKRQTLMFSATYPEDMKQAGAEFLHEPLEITADARAGASRIEQRFYAVAHEKRNAAVAQLLAHFRPASTLAFCNTRIHCRELAAELREQGFSALALHGELEQRDRDELLVQFANRSCSVLVATDVAARGLDIDQLEAVINVDVTPDTEVHVHRIGRTGRVDQAGWAFSLVSGGQMARVDNIEKALGHEIEWHLLSELQAALGSNEFAPIG